MVEIDDLGKIHATGFELEDVRFAFTRPFKSVIQGIKIDAKEDEMMNLPRYVAEILEEEGHGNVREEDRVAELKQAVVKENVQGEFELATLDEHFYVRLKSYMKKLSETDHVKVESMLNSLVRSRRSKIIRLADSSQMTADLKKKMTFEERKLYEDLHRISTEYTKEIMGDGR